MGWHFQINISRPIRNNTALHGKHAVQLQLFCSFDFQTETSQYMNVSFPIQNTHCMTVLNRELTLTTSLSVCYCCHISSSTQNGDMGPRRDSSVSGSSVGGLSRIPTIAKGSQLSMQSSFNLDIDSARGTPVRSMESPVQAMENKKKVHIKRSH